MKEKYFYIKARKAKELLHQIQGMQANKQGQDSQEYLIDEYAVLTTKKLKLRNYLTHDDNRGINRLENLI